MSNGLKIWAVGALLWGGWAVADPLPKADAVFAPVDPAVASLGQLLFYDPILSGSKTVACSTCHHPKFGTSDGLSLGLGDGGQDLGPDRFAVEDNLPEKRIPRNAPALFNLGAAEFTTLFHDGRLEADPSRPSGIRTPLGEDMEHGFASVLSAQSMFPVLSADEMAGHYTENEISTAVRLGILTGPGGAWDLIAKRIENIPAYRASFDDYIGPRPIHFTDISNALAAFMELEWRADNSPFDQYLRGEAQLPPDALAGLNLFYGKAGCAHCHKGQFQSDHEFHAIAMPQFGPGKAARFETHLQDRGRMHVTGDPDDAYAFRTPSLRNVTLTAPYGHTGAYRTLEAVLRHHLDPVKSLMTYDPSQAILARYEVPHDYQIMSDLQELSAIGTANELDPISLSDTEVAQLLAFLETLTDPISPIGRLGVPSDVPSGLPVD